LSTFAGGQIHALINFLVHFSFFVEKVHTRLRLIEGLVKAIILSDKESALGVIRIEPGAGRFFVGVDGGIEAFHLFGEVVEGKEGVGDKAEFFDFFGFFGFEIGDDTLVELIFLEEGGIVEGLVNFGSVINGLSGFAKSGFAKGAFLW
jgi:hypothetical protein